MTTRTPNIETEPASDWLRETLRQFGVEIDSLLRQAESHGNGVLAAADVRRIVEPMLLAVAPVRSTVPEEAHKRCGGRAYCGRMPFCGCGGPDGLPEFDPSKPAAERGLYRKFEIKRTDGRDQPGGKHEHCEYFVIDVTHDVHAKAALEAYAQAASGESGVLADDMRDRYGLSSPVTQQGSASLQLAEQVLALDMGTPKGLRARELARQVLAQADDMLTTLKLIEHATSSRVDDGAGHENAHSLAESCIARVMPGTPPRLASYRRDAAAIPSECPHMIVFDDADREPLLFAGAGAQAAAEQAWKQVSGQWNAHLFVCVAHNARDVHQYPVARLSEHAPRGDDR